jgi:exo-1,4-beta-D-glucosaminidase
VRLAVAAFILLSSFAFASPTPGSLPLKSGWQIQSSCKVAEKGDVISTAQFQPQDWYKAVVPGGVLANLVADKVYPEPYYGMNLRQIPGVNPIGTMFANQKMPDDSPFKCSWWYRTEFPVDTHPSKTGLGGPPEQKWLHFDGINYRANIWLNGKQIASGKDVAGTWRAFEYNVTDAFAEGKNVLAVEVFAPTENDLGFNWVDWSPAPPDKNMGLWRDVWLSFSGPVAVRNTQVISELSVPDLATAKLTVTTELRNASSEDVFGSADVSIDGTLISQPVALAPNSTKIITFTPDRYPKLILKNPRVWWPAPFGAQHLYTATASFHTITTRRGINPLAISQMPNREPTHLTLSDNETITFGIRKITGELNDKGYRQFKINGKNILIRGAGWAPDLLLNASDERIEQELRYVRHMNLNTVRLEGKIETDHFFETADRMGILVMAGWCCCDIWEQWPKWTDETRTVANESLRTQILRLRNHPSVLMWLNGSDNPPPPDVESGYLAIEKELNWPNPIVSSATAKPTTVSGASGVKMSGPYEYVPPSYWLADTDKHGGAYGFNTETSPGPAVPPVESLRKTLGQEHLWPIDDVWKFHCGLGRFKQLDVFTAAMNGRYGQASSVQDYALKSQALTYDGERAMFEAYGRNKYTSTGVIQWMLNNAWPSMIWHLYDWYLTPGGGYFGTRKANEPLHVQYSYDDGSVVVVNNLYQPFRGLRVTATVYNLDMTQKFTREATVDVAEDGVTRTLTIPAIDGLTTTYFVKLTLSDRTGRLVSSNFYWLSTQPDVLDWAKTNYYVTPVTQHADLKGLNDLPKVDVEATAATRVEGQDKVTRVVLTNPSKSLAFMVRLRLLGEDGLDVYPVFWDDNYVELVPGERREFTARVAARQLRGTAMVRIEGWNVEGKNISVQ